MSGRDRAARVRFYVDADVLGAAKILALLRPDVTYPGDPGAVVHRRARPACPIGSAATPDTEWIPRVAREGWLIITRDKRIQHHRAEVAAVRDHGAKMVALTGTDARSTWSQLEVLFSQWRRIEPLAELAGPFIWSVTRTSRTEVALGGP
jgi:hypothetical protein